MYNQFGSPRYIYTLSKILTTHCQTIKTLLKKYLLNRQRRRNSHFQIWRCLTIFISSHSPESILCLSLVKVEVGSIPQAQTKTVKKNFGEQENRLCGTDHVHSVKTYKLLQEALCPPFD